MKAFKTLIRESGDANMYFLHTKNDWIANIQLNGKYSAVKQKEIIAAISKLLDKII